jgi:hypothetical protein
MTLVYNIPDAWLTKRTTGEELLSKFTELPVTTRARAISAIEQFISKLEEGDELWRYSSPPQTWSNFCGSAGIAIVRNGSILVGCQLIMN